MQILGIATIVTAFVFVRLSLHFCFFFDNVADMYDG
jgi:hypothetical protein